MCHPLITAYVDLKTWGELDIRETSRYYRMWRDALLAKGLWFGELSVMASESLTKDFVGFYKLGVFSGYWIRLWDNTSLQEVFTN